jgi:acyl-CoA thioester hydrolase
MTSRDAFTFFHPLRVRWAEVDAQGIVFNPHYLAYFDIALMEYMRGIGFPYPDGLSGFGTDIFAVSAGLNFKASAVFDDEVDLAARVAQIGRTSITFAMAIFRGDQLIVDGTMVYVNGDRETKKPTPLPPPFLDRILAFEKQPPDRKS